VTDGDRKKYAEDFIAACRVKGLDAIAITDHHDTAFFRYIKAAAESETDDDGRVLSQEERIVVFPGMELTLGIPCQAIILLDADFPTGLLSNLNTVLASPCNPPENAKHAEVLRLEHLKTLDEIYDCLDQHDHFRGKYIILPNVSEGGTSTLLRSGFAAQYKEMPCVGGYVDGAVAQFAKGNRAIVDGKNKEYGNKAIGVFQTSDNRKSTFQDLGTYVTWVKWATPTAEALRQACLARSTRILHEDPQLPPLVVDYIDVSNCKFIGPFRVEFNPQFNCLIGGRGTGKSTILEYVRWALCDQPPPLADPDESSDFQTKRSTLIENTLLPLNAVVTVGFRVNNVPHAVRRNARTQELLLKIDDAPFIKCTEDHVRSLLPVRAYSQKQLSAVGVRTDELVRFIQAPVKQQLNDITARVNDLRSKIRNSYGIIQDKRALQKDVERDQFELESLSKQLTALRSQLKGISEEDQEVLKTHDKYMEEEQIVEGLDRNLRGARETTEKFLSEVAHQMAKVTELQTVPNRNLLAQLQAEYANTLNALKNGVNERLQLLSQAFSPTSPFGTIKTQWQTSFDTHSKQYEEAKQKATSQQVLLTQIAEIENRIKSVRSILATKRDGLEKLGVPEEEYRELRTAWSTLYAERARLLENKCQDLTRLSYNRIKATLLRGLGVERAQERLTALMVGTKIRGKRYEDLFTLVTTSEDPQTTWDRTLSELEALMLAVSTDKSSVELPHTPVLDSANYTKSELEKISRKLTPQDWLALSLLELEDKPIVMYQQREGDYIKFEDASAGQQATALLRVLLNQQGPPLIIDQPEEKTLTIK